MVATPQPNPRRRMPTVLPIAPPNRGAGIMTLPTPRPTAVERAMANRRPIREPRSLAETFAEGRDVMEGLTTGAVAGLGGLPADLTGIIFGDVPAVINKLVTGETINQEESPYFQQLNEFRRTYGAEGIMRLMGAGDRLDAPAQGDDALARAGINRFRQAAFAGEFLLDPFALAKAPKAIKRAMSPLSEQEELNLIAYERSLRGLDPNPIRADQTARTAAVAEAEQAAQRARFEELTEQAPIQEFMSFEDGDTQFFYTVTMRDGRVVEDASEERLRELYALDALQQEQDARQTARLAALDVLTQDAQARQADDLAAAAADDAVARLEGQGGTVEARTPDQLRALSLRGTEAERIADDFDDYMNAAMGTDREPGVDYVMQSIMESPDTSAAREVAEALGIGESIDDIAADVAFLIRGRNMGSIPRDTDDLFNFVLDPDLSGPDGIIEIDDAARMLRITQDDGTQEIVPADDFIDRLDDLIAADEAEVVPFGNIRFQTRVPRPFRPDTDDSPILNYTGLGNDDLQRLFLEEPLFFRINARQFNFAPDGTPLREADDQVADFTFLEFAEDRIEPRTGDVIPAGRVVAFPEMSITGVDPEDFFRIADAPPPGQAVTGEVSESIRTDRGQLPMPVARGPGEALVDATRVMPMNASSDEVVTSQVPFVDLARQGEVVDYSPLNQLIATLPEDGFIEKDEILRILRSGSGESLNRDRDSSGFIAFLEKFGGDTMSPQMVRAMYRDHTPQLRVKSILQSRLSRDRALGGPVDILRDYAQVSFADEYLVRVPKIGADGTVSGEVGEKLHIYLSNPNAVLPLTEDGVVQLRGGIGINDHGLGPKGGHGETGREGPTTDGVPGYFGHIRIHVIEDDQGRKIGIIQEIQSNTAVEERRVARGESDKTFFGPEASYTLDLLRESEEGRRVFNEAAQSSLPRDSALSDELGFYGQSRDDTYTELGNDLIVVGGENVSLTDARDTLRALNDPGQTYVGGIRPVEGGSNDMMDLIMEVVPKVLGEEAKRTNSLSSSFQLVPGEESTRILPNVMRMTPEFPDTAGASVAANIDRMFFTDGVLSPEQIDKFNDAFLARIREIEAAEAAIPEARRFDEMKRFYEGQGARDGLLPDSYYRRVRQAVQGLDLGDPNAMTPYEFFKSQFDNPTGEISMSDFRSLVNNDPGMFGFIGVDVNNIPLNQTSSSRAAMMQRTMKNRMETALKEDLEDFVLTRGNTLTDQVPTSESVRQMNQVIDTEYADLPESVRNEMKSHFETYVKTINNVDGSQAFKVGTPFGNSRDADTYFTQFATRLAVQEAEKLGLDGIIFPNWMDMRDTPTRSGIPAQNIYGGNVDKGLKQAGYKLEDDNRGPADVVTLPTIMAKNQNTGAIEPLPHLDTRAAGDHREARAIYFDRSRTRRRRYRPEDRPPTGEQEFTEDLGTVGEMTRGKLLRRAKGGPVDLRPKKLIHSGIGGMARQVM